MTHRAHSPAKVRIHYETGKSTLIAGAGFLVVDAARDGFKIVGRTYLDGCKVEIDGDDFTRCFDEVTA